MLERIHIQNFKAHANTPISFAPITILIGKNNTGKSSIFQIVQLLKQSDRVSMTELCPRDEFKPGIGYDVYQDRYGQEAERVLFDLDDDRLINIGDYKDVVRNPLLPIRCEIVGSVYQRNVHLSNELNKYQFVINETFKDNRIMDFEFSIEGDKMKSASTEDFKVENQPDTYRVDIPNPDITFTLRYNSRIGDPINNAGFGYKQNISTAEADNFRARGDLFANTIRAFLNSCRFIYGIRGFEKKYYYLIEEPFKNIELANLHIRNMATVSALPHNRILEEQMNLFFKDLLNMEIKFELFKARFVELRAYSMDYGKETSIINEGLGVQQLYSILIPLALANNHDTVFIEEPEIHIHPDGQSDLVDILIKAHQIRNLQYIISTHSEHILLNFLKNVKRGYIKKSDIKIYSFSLDEDGASVVQELNIDETGQLSEGIPGFMDANLNLIKEMLFQE